MTPAIAIVLAVVFAAMILFWTELVPVELVGIGALIVLILCDVIDVSVAFQGFGSEALVMIASVLVLSASLVRNGAGETAANRIESLSGTGSERMASSLFVSVAGISAFINNVAATAMFLPVAESLSRTFNVRPSRLLMPVAYASLLGGVCTLTGTSTNVAVSGGMTKAGLEPLGVFELSKIGVPLAVLGLIYLVIASRWLPGRAGSEDVPLEDAGGRRLFLTELLVPDGSPAIGRTIHELELLRRYRLSAVGLIRGAVRLSQGVLDTPLRADDVLVVEGDVGAINRGAVGAGLMRKPSKKITPEIQQRAPALMEATISYNSPLLGRTLREIDIRGRYGLDVIAIWRRGGAIVEKVGDIRLRLGDDLLIQGPVDRIRQLARDPLHLLLNDRVFPRYDWRKELTSVGLFGVALVLAATGLAPVPVAFLMAAVAVIILGCIPLEESYRALNLKLLILIGSMIGVAVAIDQSETAMWLSHQMLDLMGGENAEPLLVLSGLYWLTVLLTLSMSNAAAALLVLPIGLEAAQMVGIDPRSAAVTIAVSASLAFMTPLEPACLLVISTGRYRFLDFVRFGAPITALSYVVVIGLVPVFFPL